MHLWTNSESLKKEELFQIKFCSLFFSTKKILVLLSASVKRFDDSHMQDYFYRFGVFVSSSSVLFFNIFF